MNGRARPARSATVILERAQWYHWLNVKKDMAPSFRGSPAGSITVEQFVEAAAAPQLYAECYFDDWRSEPDIT